MNVVEDALIAVRLGQYLGSALLFGGGLLLARQPTFAFESGERRVLLGSTALLAVSTLAALFVQAANMAGEASPFVEPSMVGMVLTSTGFGYAVVVRIAASLLALAILARADTRRSLAIAVGLGAMATASLAWGGHGMADEGLAGAIHVSGDIIHLLRANAWIGALGVLLTMAIRVGRSNSRARADRLRVALAGFAGFGTLAVGLLIATGLVNSWFLIGPARIGTLTTSFYGELLLAKLAVFAGI